VNDRWIWKELCFKEFNISKRREGLDWKEEYEFLQFSKEALQWPYVIAVMNFRDDEKVTADTWISKFVESFNSKKKNGNEIFNLRMDSPSSGTWIMRVRVVKEANRIREDEVTKFRFLSISQAESLFGTSSRWMNHCKDLAHQCPYLRLSGFFNFDHEISVSAAQRLERTCRGSFANTVSDEWTDLVDKVNFRVVILKDSLAYAHVFVDDSKKLLTRKTQGLYYKHLMAEVNKQLKKNGIDSVVDHLGRQKNRVLPLLQRNSTFSFWGKRRIR
jgi:hypothetical protein